MSNILDDFHTPSSFHAGKIALIIFLMACASVILNMIQHYLLTPNLPTKLSSDSTSDVNEVMGLLVMGIMILICYLLAKKINTHKPYVDNKWFILWGASCILISELLFNFIVYFLIEKTGRISHLPYILKDVLMLAFQGGLISYILILKIRNQSYLLPLAIFIGIILILDTLFSYNII